MKNFICSIVLFFCFNPVFACDCKPISIEEGYAGSSTVALGRVIRAELKTYIITAENKDSIWNHYQRLIFNDTISFVEYTIKVIKDYKGSSIMEDLIVRAEATHSNCDISLKVGSIYMVYGHNDWLTNLYYPKDKKFILSSICTRTSINWEREQQELEKYLQENN